MRIKRRISLCFNLYLRQRQECLPNGGPLLLTSRKNVQSHHTSRPVVAQCVHLIDDLPSTTYRLGHRRKCTSRVRQQQTDLFDDLISMLVLHVRLRDVSPLQGSLIAVSVTHTVVGRHRRCDAWSRKSRLRPDSSYGPDE